jgi:glycosidase
MLLPGTPTIYNGDEIAMRDLFIPFSKCQDPMCLHNKRDFASVGRDPERTPMQWDASNQQAGFSDNAHTWLPVNPDYVLVNVEAEHQHGQSTTQDLRAQRHISPPAPMAIAGQNNRCGGKWKLRQRCPSSAKDKLVAITINVFTYPGLSSISIALVVTNLDAKHGVAVGSVAQLLPTSYRDSRLRWNFSTHARSFPEHGAPAQPLTLCPGEVAVLVSF